MSTFSVSSIIEKSESRDKDLRHMALYDLNTELQKPNFQMEESSQRQLAEVVLKLLDDSSSEVQGMAVKCLAPLVIKMSKAQIENSVTKLSNSILSGDDEKRDIAKLALKTVVSKIENDKAPGPISKMLQPLLQAVNDERFETKQDALEVLADVLSRFGALVAASHETMQAAFIKELNSKRPTVRKRAIMCLAALSVYSSDKLFQTLITDAILDGIRRSQAGGEDLRTYINAASAISKTSGHRFGKYLDKFVPLLLKVAESVSEAEGEDEVREGLMQAFESFVIRCPEEIKKFIGLIVILCKEYLEYDPNYSYDSDEEEEEEDGDKMDESDDSGASPADDEEEEEDEGEEDDYSDEDDISWKVRTAAVKCLGAMVRHHVGVANTLFKELNSADEHPLIDRFKERSESVKLEIFAVFNDLLGLASSGSPQLLKHVKDTKPLIVKRLGEQLKTRSSRVRLGSFTVLKRLVTVLQGGLNEKDIAMVVQAVRRALQSRDDQNITLKLEVLSFLRLLLKFHNEKMFVKHIDVLSRVVYERGVREKYYKIIAESLRVCGELVRVIAALRSTATPAVFNKHVKDIYTTVSERLEIQDIDQDVKESAITAMGLILAELQRNSTEVNLKRTLPVLVERLDNEITRLTTCKTFGVIARAGVDISAVLQQVVTNLSQYLRKSNRPLRQASLQTLNDIVHSFSAQISRDMIKSVLGEVEKLITDADLFLAHLSLQLTATVISTNPQLAKDVYQVVFPKILDLLESTTLQGAALESLLAVLGLLVQPAGFATLLQAVLERAQGSKSAASKQVLTNFGKSIAALCQKASQAEQKSTVDRFAADLTRQDRALLALYTLGEMGRTIDLSKNSAIQAHIESFFDTGSEEIKNAASFAFGNIAAGNLQHYVPLLVNEVRTNQKRKYLLLHSLKEVISHQVSLGKGENLRPFVAQLVTVMFENCAEEEEGIRNVVSECLGKLALVDYASVLQKLREMLSSDKVIVRASAVSALKYTISDQTQQIDAQLRKDVSEFIKVGLDKSKQDVKVRRAAVLLMTSVIHNRGQAGWITADMLPRLYDECVFNKDLVRIIDLGPFKHQEDDGLELRKSAFECLDTLIDANVHGVDGTSFVKQLVLGLADPNQDIKMLCHLILSKAAGSYPEEILALASELAEPIHTTLKATVKENAVAQEKERMDELHLSTLRAVATLSRSVKGIQEHTVFYEKVFKLVETNAALKNMYRTVESDDSQSSKMA